MVYTHKTLLYRRIVFYLCHPLEIVFVKIEVDLSPLLVLFSVRRALCITRPEHALRPASTQQVTAESNKCVNGGERAIRPA